MANDMPDTPATPDRWRGVRTELATVSLYTFGYLLGNPLLLLFRLWFALAAH